MSFTPFSPPLQLVASTGVAGFTKVNATPNILTWTAPSDGAVHQVLIFATETVTSAETGGAISTNETAPGGGSQVGAGNIVAGGKTIGTYHQNDGMVIGAGTTLTVLQSAALSAGASTIWITVWAS